LIAKVIQKDNKVEKIGLRMILGCSNVTTGKNHHGVFRYIIANRRLSASKIAARVATRQKIKVTSQTIHKRIDKHINNGQLLLKKS
jgi:hypothetical protein